MLSSGGALAGSIWTDIPRQPSDFFQASHFVLATRRRLGIVVVPEGTPCCIPENKGNSTVPRLCGEFLDHRLTHPTSACTKQAAKSRTHDLLKMAIGASLKSAGAIVDFERCVPSLARDTHRPVRVTIIWTELGGHLTSLPPKYSRLRKQQTFPSVCIIQEQSHPISPQRTGLFQSALPNDA